MLKQLFFIDTWTFAYANDFNDFSNIENCRWKIIKPRLFHSMADPSITQTNTTEDKLDIIYENINFFTGKGSIKDGEIKLTKNRFQSKGNIINNRFHTSFPNIFKVQDSEYLIYENEEASSLGIVEKNTFSNINIEGEFLDPVILSINSDNYLISSYRNFENNLKFKVYEISNNFDIKESDREYIHNANSVRNAGKIIYLENCIFRPGQNTLGRYGSYLIINKLSIEDKRIIETEYKVIKPNLIDKNANGTHNISVNENFVIVDLRYSKFFILAFVIKLIRLGRKYSNLN